jgi:hypothetical protein
VDVRNRFIFFNPVGADQNTPPDDPEILQRGREELNQKNWLDKKKIARDVAAVNPRIIIQNKRF